MPRLLMSASSARVTGTIELACAEENLAATLVMVRGLVTKVKTSAPVAYLGAVLYELGHIDTHVLNDSLHELSRAKCLHGEILVSRGEITHLQLLEGLHEQTTRKLVHLFTLPPATAFRFDSNVDHLPSWGGADFPHVDPGPAVWRGIREGFAQEDVDAVFAREAQTAFRLVPAADATRFELSDVDLTAAEWLRGRSLTADELAGRALIDPRRAREILYFLLVTKQAEPIDTSGVRPAYRPLHDAHDSHTKPTRPAMPAVTPSSRPPSSRPENESAQWRAAGNASGYASSAKVAVSELPVESGKMPAARGSMSYGTPAAAWKPSTPATAWKVSPSTPASALMSPNTPGSAWKIPPNIPSSVPPRITMGAGEPLGSTFRRATPLQTQPPSGHFRAKTPLTPPPVDAADSLEADLLASGVSDPYEGARACFARGDIERAERLARRATEDAPDAAKPLALLAWIEATNPANAFPEETMRCIALLDRALAADDALELAYYWRALLHKRLENHPEALRDLRKVIQLNPRHTEAVRELRVYEMRIRRKSITMKGVK